MAEPAVIDIDWALDASALSLLVTTNLRFIHGCIAVLSLACTLPDVTFT